MPESLIEQLPKIVAEGKKEVERILERLSGPNRLALQTNEYVLPSKDKSGLFRGEIKELNEQEWHNRLIYGDNLLVMQALLAGDPATGLSSMRGKIDLIYIDPPFDSKADYRTKITLPSVSNPPLVKGAGGALSVTIEQKPTVLEQFAYSDTWKDGTVSYLQMIYPRLVLMRELLSDQGSIYVHLDWHVGHYVKVLMDEVFGKDCFVNEIIWKSGVVKGAKTTSSSYGRMVDSIFFYSKTNKRIFKTPFKPIDLNSSNNKFVHKDENGRLYSRDTPYDEKLEVLVIPPDLLDKLKTKSSYQGLLKSGKIRFSSLQYLSIRKPVIISYSSDIDEIKIELDNYILLSPDALPLDD